MDSPSDNRTDNGSDHWSVTLAQWHYRVRVHPVCRLLQPISWIYGLGARLHRQLYAWGMKRRVTPPVPVISVGNITTGGTGKTPVVQALAQVWQDASHRPVILSRGYGAERVSPYQRAESPVWGDEPYLLQESLPEVPVIVGRDRSYTATRACEEYHPDVLLLDDGFQHWPLNRHYDIVLVDGQLGLGNGCQLPAGPLREPVSALKRAHRIWITRPPEGGIEAVLKAWPVLRDMAREGIPIEAVPIEPLHLASFDGQMVMAFDEMAAMSHQVPVVCVSAIARPERLERQLGELGIRILRHHHFPDHHSYTPDEVIRMLSDEGDADTLWITTDKDRVKLASLIPRALHHQCYTLKIQAQLPEKATQAMLRLFTRPLGHPAGRPGSPHQADSPVQDIISPSTPPSAQPEEP